MFEHISEQGSPYEGVLKEASEDFDNLNQALRILSASIEDHINNLTQGKKPEEVLEFFEKYEEKIVVGSSIIGLRQTIIFSITEPACMRVLINVKAL